MERIKATAICFVAYTAIRNLMKVLLDTDAFCKMAIAEVLEPAVGILGAEIVDCGRLPALPHMLRKGRLRKQLGPDVCDSLMIIGKDIPELLEGRDWLERLSSIDAIDPGEAQIFASAAEHGSIVITGDKRSLGALKNVEGISTILAGRIVVLEAVFIALCNHLGPVEVGRRVQSLKNFDKVVEICFSSPNSDPREGLRSYYDSLVSELHPLSLWMP
jgi:hypothetical protein